MKSYSKITPEGTRDILFDEAGAQREVQARLSRLFFHRGYHEVFTPGLEYFDVFCLPGAAFPQQEMYKTTDDCGRLVVFRPDSTLPIARMAASRLQNQPRPLRLFYAQTVYRNSPALSGRSTERPQMGIELLGAGGLRADLEAVSLAVEAVTACTEDFRLEIGHARLFQVLADRLPVLEGAKEELRTAIEMKNYGALDQLLDPLGDTPAVEAMRRLPRLFGGEETFQKAEQWFSEEETGGVLTELKNLFHAFEQLGLRDRLMVDLGLVQPNDYYTGLVFSIYVPGRGDALLSGGRYDSLCEKFGAPMPAVGFALDLAAAAALLGPRLEKDTVSRVLVHGDPGFEPEAQKMAGGMAAQGAFCQTSLFTTVEEALAYAGKAGISKVVQVGSRITEYDIKQEDGTK